MCQTIKYVRWIAEAMVSHRSIFTHSKKTVNSRGRPTCSRSGQAVEGPPGGAAQFGEQRSQQLAVQAAAGIQLRRRRREVGPRDGRVRVPVPAAAAQSQPGMHSR